MKPLPQTTIKLLMVILTVPGTLFFCSSPLHPNVPYNPPVSFSGFINGREVSMKGNFFWPNCCTLKNDTIRMYFYSDDFSEDNKVRQGDFMRLFLFPDSSDLLGIKHMYFHLARYHEYNSSYSIAPRDTHSRLTTIQMHRVALTAARKSSVSIDRIYVQTGVISNTTGERIEITKGSITGAVQ